MAFDEWKRLVRNAGADPEWCDFMWLTEQFSKGVSPAQVAAMIKSGNAPKRQSVSPQLDPISRPTKKPTPQHPSVLSDPKYRLDTGQGLHCPVCGSTFINVAGKPGSGLGAIGSLQFVLAATVIEGMIKAAQKQVYMCGYCNSLFTEGGTGYADPTGA